MAGKNSTQNTNGNNNATNSDEKISATIFCDIKGLDNTKRFVLSKKYPDESYTYTEWENIIASIKL